jgi:hypothetical protein
MSKLDEVSSLKAELAKLQEQVHHLSKKEKEEATPASSSSSSSSSSSTQPPKQKTIVDEINELNTEFGTLAMKADEVRRRQIEIAEKLIPAQIAFFKNVIEQLQAENKTLKDQQSSKKEKE